MDLKEILYKIERENPNNMELGNSIRNLVRSMKELQSKEVNNEQLSGQINIFGEVKKW